MSACKPCKSELQSQVKELHDLIEVAQTVVSTLDLDRVLQAILASAMKLAETPAGSIALYDWRKRELTLHAHAGLTAEFVRNERWEVKPGGLTEQVLKKGKMLVVEDTREASFFNNSIALKEGIRSLVGMPLVFQERVVGLLYLDDFSPRRFDRSRLKLLSILASFAAMSISNATLHQQTKLLAITDQLTGLHNHRYFKQFFEQEMVRAKRYQKPLSMILLDVDNFKTFNDRFGHAMGDRALSCLGKIIPLSVRSIDVSFRYGGEEFVVLLPETGLDSAITVAERLRETVRVRSAQMMRDFSVPGLTASVGVASYPDNANSCDELFHVVDQLLYRAKSEGKNAVHYQTFSAAVSQ